MASSNMARRNAAARARGFISYSQQRRFSNTIRNRAELAKLPPAAQRTRQAALDALATSRREGVDLTTAAQRENVTLDAVAYWAGDAARRHAGVWQPSPADRLFRPMYVFSDGRATAIDVRGSRTATLVGRYHAAVQHYLNTGDDSRLQRLAGVSVAGVELETDLDVIDDLARRGAFDFESIYRMVH